MLNAAASQAAKQAGQQLALDMSGDWKAEVLLELRGWLAIHKAKGNETMTFEQFRAEARNQPKSHKAWGALPRLACKEGLIRPLVHQDGSPVMRAAESLKTHGHPVRCWIVSAFFSPPATGCTSPTSIENQPERALHRPCDRSTVGVGLHAQARREGVGG